MMDLLRELLQFLGALKQYKEILTNPDSKILEAKRKSELFAAFPFLQEALPKKSKEEVKEEIREGLIRKSGALKEKIIELTAKQYFTRGMSRYDMWVAAFNPLIRTQYAALAFCIDAVNEAIGKLEEDIKKGKRDPNTGERIGVISAELEVDTAVLPAYLFDKMQLHPKVIEASKSLFETGHYAQAIFEAFKAVNNFVKEKTGRTEDGKDLMAKVFNENAPIIKLNDLLTQSDKDEQEGFKFLFMGAMVGIRNPKAHESIIQRDPYRTLEYLAFASLLMKRVEEGKVSKLQKGKDV